MADDLQYRMAALMRDVLQAFMDMPPILAAVWAGLLAHVAWSWLEARWIDGSQGHHDTGTDQDEAQQFEREAEAGSARSDEGAGNE